jgi:hypothetical protein
MVTASKIREGLVDLLANFNEASLAAFEEWLTAESWNMQSGSDLDTQKLVGEIQLRIAETDDENQSRDWLKGKLRAILSTYSLSISLLSDSVKVSSGSSTAFTSQEWAFSRTDSPRVKAYG